MRKMRIARAAPGMRTTYIATDPARDRPGMIAGKMKNMRRRWATPSCWTRGIGQRMKGTG